MENNTYSSSFKNQMRSYIGYHNQQSNRVEIVTMVMAETFNSST